MKVCAIDTSLTGCGCAVVDSDGGILAHSSREIGRGHAEILLPMVEATLKNADKALGDIDRFAVTIGPGSFTGIRVGVSAARGFALVTGAPVSGVLTLDALAQGAMEPAHDGEIVALIDARRGEVYLRRYSSNAVPIDEPRLVAVESLAHEPISAGALVVGSGAALLPAAFAPAQRIDMASPDVVQVAWRAIAEIEMPKPAEPIYIRPPDAAPHRPQVAVLP